MPRVLHVIRWMGRGGAETWLMHVLRNIDRNQYHLDFLVQTREPGHFDKEIVSLGSRLLYCEGAPNILKFSIHFMSVVRKNGPYDAVHSHLHHFSGIVLLLAYVLHIPIRVVHCHSAILIGPQKMPFFRKCYLRATELLISAFSTVGLACSVPAAADLFGAGWQKQSKNKVLHCGIDLNDFAGKVNKGDILREFNIPTHAKIVGHVGRFVPVKNHDFILEIARDLIQVDPSVYFLLLGGGNLRKRIQEKIEMLGINSNIVLAGVRSDVPKLLSNIMDVFVLPSFYEGLGLSFVEAQTAGLPCVVSDTIPLEADIIPDLVTRLSLTTPASLWANKIRELLNKERLVDRESSLRKVKGSSFNIDYSVRSLEEIYSGNPGSPSCG